MSETPTPDLTERARDGLMRAICSVTNHWDEPLDEVHDVPQIVNAVLAWVVEQSAAHDEQVRREAKAEVWGEAVQATADAVWSKPGRPRWGWAAPINPYRDGGAR